MKLDSTQRKYIKKWVKTKSVDAIALDLSVTPDEVLSYLKQRWDRDKFDRFQRQYLAQMTGRTSSEQTSPVKWQWLSDHWMHIFGLFVLIAIIYFNTLDNAFVSDDIAGIVTNTNIGNINHVFSSFLSAIGALEYFLIYHIFGLSPTFFRLNNIIFHFFNAVAVYWLVETLTNRRVGLVTSILFAVHPIQTEAVTWISGGLVSHSAFFVLTALTLFVKSLGKSMLDKKYLLAVFLFFIGVYFSEKNMGFPMILCVLLFSTRQIKQNWQKTIPFFLISAIWIFTYISMIPARIDALNVEYSAATTLGNPLIQVPIAISSYLQMIALPYNLSFYHTQQAIGWPEMIVRSVVAGMVFLIAILSLRKNRMILFWLAFFILALSPTLTPFGISSLVAERYVYLATVGIYVLVGLVFDKLFTRASTQNLVTALAVVVVIVLMATTYLRNQDWQNQDTLWLATARTAPNSPQNNNNLGDYYGRQGDMQMAIKHFQRAIELNPGYSHAHHNLANIYGHLGQLDLALTNYQQAIKFNPNQWQSYQQMALIYYLQKDQANALLYIDKALSLNPTDQKLQQQKQIIETGVVPEE